jgi:hypothetical protein
MNRALYGLATLPFLAGVAAAGQSMQLSDKQMDNVTAGFEFRITQISNTSWVQEVAWPITAGGPTACAACYLNITSSALNVQAAFGPSPNT